MGEAIPALKYDAIGWLSPHALALEGRRRVDSSLMTCYASICDQRISFVRGKSDG